MLRKCGWEITRARNKKLESLRALVQWIYLQFEYAEEDVSLYTFPEDIYASPNYQIVDQEGGYEKVPKTYASIHELEGLITYNTRVQHIKYDVGGDSSRAYVIAENTTDASCTGYFAERVISTLPAPIYNEGLVTFDPPLKYSPDEYSPFEMKVYMRIYYEFADQDKFWDDSEYIFSGKEGGELAIRGTVSSFTSRCKKKQIAISSSLTFPRCSRINSATIGRTWILPSTGGIRSTTGKVQRILLFQVVTLSCVPCYKKTLLLLLVFRRRRCATTT